MSIKTDLKASIDTIVTNATTDNKVEPSDLGLLLKMIVDYANPQVYSVYRALITQTGNSAPELNVLENTTGLTPTAIYSSVGNYSILYGRNQTPAKVQVFLGGSEAATAQILLSALSFAASAVGLRSYNIQTASPFDDGFKSTAIEIRIYP